MINWKTESIDNGGRVNKHKIRLKCSGEDYIGLDLQLTVYSEKSWSDLVVIKKRFMELMYKIVTPVKNNDNQYCYAQMVENTCYGCGLCKIDTKIDSQLINEEKK